MIGGRPVEPLAVVAWGAVILGFVLMLAGERVISGVLIPAGMAGVWARNVVIAQRTGRQGLLIVSALITAGSASLALIRLLGA